MALFGHKLCDLCNKARATVKITRIDPGEIKEMLVCQSCASEHSPLHRRSEEAGAGLQALFANLLKEKEAEEAAARPGEKPATCATCGLPFDTYRKTFLLGCPACYESFEEALLADLRKIHGDTHHRGKCPKGQAADIQRQANLAVLRQRLSEAIAREDFEAAARIRDQLRAAERGQG